MEKRMVFEQGEKGPEIITEPVKSDSTQSNRLDKIDRKLNAILKALGVSAASLEEDTDDTN